MRRRGVRSTVRSVSLVLLGATKKRLFVRAWLDTIDNWKMVIDVSRCHKEKRIHERSNDIPIKSKLLKQKLNCSVDDKVSYLFQVLWNDAPLDLCGTKIILLTMRAGHDRLFNRVIDISTCHKEESIRKRSNDIPIMSNSLHER